MSHSEEKIDARADGDLAHAPLPFAPSRRSSGDLTHPVMESERVTNPPAVVEDFGAGEGANTVREDAEGSLHFLNFTSLKPAVLLARAWHVIGVPFAFEHLDLYREVAATSHSSLVEIARPDKGGLEHLVFAARIGGLSDEEYLECIEGGPETRS